MDAREIDIPTEIRALTVGIDACIATSRTISACIARDTGGREVALCITKLQEANHWLVDALAELSAVENE